MIAKFFLKAAIAVVVFLEEDKEYRSRIACLAFLMGLVAGKIFGTSQVAIVMMTLAMMGLFFVSLIGRDAGISGRLESILEDNESRSESSDSLDSVQDPGLDAQGDTAPDGKILKIPRDEKGL